MAQKENMNTDESKVKAKHKGHNYDLLIDGKISNMKDKGKG